MQRASSHQAMLAIFSSKKGDYLERNIDHTNLQIKYSENITNESMTFRNLEVSWQNQQGGIFNKGILLNFQNSLLFLFASILK